MKTSIIITGQIHGKHLLKSLLEHTWADTIKRQYGYEIVFRTKKEAVKALSEAYRNLSSDKEDWNNSSATYLYGYGLGYDASRAQISETVK